MSISVGPRPAGGKVLNSESPNTVRAGGSVGRKTAHMTSRLRLVLCHLASLLSLEGEESGFLLPTGEKARACPELIEGMRGRAPIKSALAYD